MRSRGAISLEIVGRIIYDPDRRNRALYRRPFADVAPVVPAPAILLVGVVESVSDPVADSRPVHSVAGACEVFYPIVTISHRATLGRAFAALVHGRTAHRCCAAFRTPDRDTYRRSSALSEDDDGDQQFAGRCGHLPGRPREDTSGPGTTRFIAAYRFADIEKIEEHKPVAAAYFQKKIHRTLYERSQGRCTFASNTKPNICRSITKSLMKSSVIPLTLKLTPKTFNCFAGRVREVNRGHRSTVVIGWLPSVRPYTRR